MLLNANPKKTFIALLFLCIVILSIPIFLRVKMADSAYIGSESYASHNLGEIVEKSGFASFDKLSFSGREIRYEYGFPLLISFAPDIMNWLLPLLFGVLSFALFYLIIKKYDADIALISSILLLLSPTFLYLFSVSIKFSGAVLFCLLGLYFFLKGEHYRYYAYLAFLFVGFFSIEIALILIFIGLILLYYKKINLKDYALFFAAMFLLLFLEFRSWLFNFWIFFPLNPISNFFNSATGLFFDIGAKTGFGIFIFILAFIGIYYLWNHQYKYLLGYLLACACLYLIMLMPFLIYFFNFFVVVLGAYGLIYLIDTNWKSPLLRNLTLIVVICGILFSGLSFLHYIGQAEPSKDFVKGMVFLKSIPNEFIVFSDVSRGVYIGYAGKRNVADNNFVGAPNLDERLRDINRLLHANKIEEAKSIIYKYNIRYIWMDKQMKEMLYTNDEDELLFILKYSPNDFIKAYSNDEVEIWEVLFRR